MDELKGRTLRDCVSVMMLNARERCVQHEFIAEWLGHSNPMKFYSDGTDIEPQEIYGVPDNED